MYNNFMRKHITIPNTGSSITDNNIFLLEKVFSEALHANKDTYFFQIINSKDYKDITKSFDLETFYEFLKKFNFKENKVEFVFFISKKKKDYFNKDTSICYASLLEEDGIKLEWDSKKLPDLKKELIKKINQ